MEIGRKDGNRGKKTKGRRNKTLCKKDGNRGKIPWIATETLNNCNGKQLVHCDPCPGRVREEDGGGSSLVPKQSSVSTTRPPRTDTRSVVRSGSLRTSLHNSPVVGLGIEPVVLPWRVTTTPSAAQWQDCWVRVPVSSLVSWDDSRDSPFGPAFPLFKQAIYLTGKTETNYLIETEENWIRQTDVFPLDESKLPDSQQPQRLLPRQEDRKRESFLSAGVSRRGLTFTLRTNCHSGGPKGGKGSLFRPRRMGRC